MKRYLYLSLMPEAMIVSMLPPKDFGNYLAIGTKKRTRGEAIFFELDMEVMADDLPMEYIERRCIPNNQGKPKSSVYLSIYRTLENTPLAALKNLYMVTDDGRVLELEQGQYEEKSNSKLHLYQQLCPVTPRIASSLGPEEFMNYVTNTEQPVSVPKLVFVELMLDKLADDPSGGATENLPYRNIDHLRDCLIGLQGKPDKPSKTVIRFFQGDLLYRTCKNGVFIGEKGKMCYYPLPDLETLQEKHYAWWRSSLTVGF